MFRTTIAGGTPVRLAGSSPVLGAASARSVFQRSPFMGAEFSDIVKDISSAAVKAAAAYEEEKKKSEEQAAAQAAPRAPIAAPSQQPGISTGTVLLALGGLAAVGIVVAVVMSRK